MRNVNLYLDPQLILSIAEFSGNLLPTRTDHPPTLDDRESFSFAIDSAVIAISTHSLQHLLAHYAFAYPECPIKQLEISVEDGQLMHKGVVRRGIDLPFEMSCTVEATPEGLLRLHPITLKTAYVPVKGLMNLFRMGVDDLIDANGARGVRIERDNLIMNPEKMLPPPHMRGRIRAARIQGDHIVMFFGNAASTSGLTRRNLISFRGGVLRFGRLTFDDADLRLIDSTQRDPFAFFLDHYEEQLTAGYSKMTPRLGLDVSMLDYDKLKTRRK